MQLLTFIKNLFKHKEPNLRSKLIASHVNSLHIPRYRKEG